MRVFEAGCGSGGGGGVKENVEVSIFQGIDMEKLMDRKMKETVWVLSKGKERERERDGRKRELIFPYLYHRKE